MCIDNFGLIFISGSLDLKIRLKYMHTNLRYFYLIGLRISKTLSVIVLETIYLKHFPKSNFEIQTVESKF